MSAHRPNAAQENKLIWKAFKYRLYPNDEQKRYFEKLFTCCRFVYNHFLDERIAAWEAKQAGEDVKVPSQFDMTKALTALKKDTLDAQGHPYLKEVDSTAYLYEIQALNQAYSAFFRRLSRGGAGFPRYKTKGSKQSATITFKKADVVEGRRIKFPKIGWVRAKVHRPLEGEPICATIRKDSADNWWVSIKCKNVCEEQLPKIKKSVIIKLDEWPIVTTEDGKVVAVINTEDSPQEDKRLRRELRRLRRRSAPDRNEPASHRYEKQRVKVARMFAKRADQIHAEIEKLSSDLVEQFGSIAVIRPAKDLPKGAGELIRQLEYKCEWRGRIFNEIVDE